ncbi:putative cytochrome P450 [Phyllosticta citriasiana]|uniref:Cytochrome P450 n=1 Tax=Phyllosticta citriasiana TaxID=595635 RepID=A0ABR1KJS7_9PEZI
MESLIFLRRRLLHQALTAKALELYKPAQTAEASRLCGNFLRQADGWEKLFEWFVGSTTFSIAYGQRVDSLEADVVREIVSGMKYIGSLNVPGKYLVETFPILKHVPYVLAPWKREVKQNGKRFTDSALAQDKQAASAAPSLSLANHLIERRGAQSDLAISRTVFAFIPAALFGGGTDTTVGMLCTVVLALVTNPSVQRTAQAELDAVVGPSRSPTFADYPNLPYTRALIHRALRWRPVSVLGGAPHASTAPCSFGPWHIPRGTPVVGNVWAIKNEAACWAGEAASFDFAWAFQFWMGSELALNTLFIGEGRSYDAMAYIDGFNMRPQRFECDIRVRSEKHREVLLAEEREAWHVLKQFPAFD